MFNKKAAVLERQAPRGTLNLGATNREVEVLGFIEKYIVKFGSSPTDNEIAFEFRFTLSRASAIVRNLQLKQRILVGPPRRTIKVL